MTKTLLTSAYQKSLWSPSVKQKKASPFGRGGSRRLTERVESAPSHPLSRELSLRDSLWLSCLPPTSSAYLSVGLLYHTFANKSRRKPCISSNGASPAAIWCFSLRSKWCCSFHSQWCDVCHKMWRSHASLGEAVIIGEANIICRRQTSFKKRTFVGRQKCGCWFCCLNDASPCGDMMNLLRKYDVAPLRSAMMRCLP